MSVIFVSNAVRSWDAATATAASAMYELDKSAQV